MVPMLYFSQVLSYRDCEPEQRLQSATAGGGVSLEDPFTVQGLGEGSLVQSRDSPTGWGWNLCYTRRRTLL